MCLWCEGGWVRSFEDFVVVVVLKPGCNHVKAELSLNYNALFLFFPMKNDSRKRHQVNFRAVTADVRQLLLENCNAFLLLPSAKRSLSPLKPTGSYSASSDDFLNLSCSIRLMHMPVLFSLVQFSFLITCCLL